MWSHWPRPGSPAEAPSSPHQHQHRPHNRTPASRPTSGKPCKTEGTGGGIERPSLPHLWIGLLGQLGEGPADRECRQQYGIVKRWHRSPRKAKAPGQLMPWTVRRPGAGVILPRAGLFGWWVIVQGLPTRTPRKPCDNRGPATVIKPNGYEASLWHLPVGCVVVALGWLPPVEWASLGRGMWSPAALAVPGSKLGDLPTDGSPSLERVDHRRRLAHRDVCPVGGPECPQDAELSVGGTVGPTWV
jgi:hypothetical protein